MKNILNEEINKMKYLFNYNRGLTLSEQKNVINEDVAPGGLVGDWNPSTGEYTIAKGDTLSKIGNAFGVKLMDIWEKNKGTLRSGKPNCGKYCGYNWIFVGEVVTIPGKAETTTTQNDTSVDDTTLDTTGDTTSDTTLDTITKIDTASIEKPVVPKPKSWCEKNTKQGPPYNERCFSMKGKDENDATKKLKIALEADFKEYKNKKSSFWDNSEKILYQVWSTVTLNTNGVENQQSTNTTTNAETERETKPQDTQPKLTTQDTIDAKYRAIAVLEDLIENAEGAFKRMKKEKWKDSLKELNETNDNELCSNKNKQKVASNLKGAEDNMKTYGFALSEAEKQKCQKLIDELKKYPEYCKY